jgi:hypothetical protein
LVQIRQQLQAQARLVVQADHAVIHLRQLGHQNLVLQV